MFNSKKFIFISLLLLAVVDASAEFTTSGNIDGKTYSGVGLDDFKQLVRIEKFYDFSNSYDPDVHNNDGTYGNWKKWEDLGFIENVTYDKLDFNFDYKVGDFSGKTVKDPITGEESSIARYAYRLNADLINTPTGTPYTTKGNENGIVFFTYDLKNKDNKNFYIFDFGAVLYENTTNTKMEELEQKYYNTFSIVSIADNVTFTVDLNKDNRIKGLITNNEYRGQYNSYFLNGKIEINEDRILNANLVSTTSTTNNDNGSIVFNKNSSLVYSVISKLNTLQFNGDNQISNALQVYKDNGGTYFRIDVDIPGGNGDESRYVLNEFNELGVKELNKLNVLSGILDYDKSVSYDMVSYETISGSNKANITVNKTVDTDFNVVVNENAELKVWNNVNLGAENSEKTVSGKGTVELKDTESKVRIKIDNLGKVRFGENDSNAKKFSISQQIVFGGNGKNSVNSLQLMNNKTLEYNKDILFNRGDKAQSEIILEDDSKLILAQNSRIDGDNTIKLFGGLDDDNHEKKVANAEIEFSKDSYAKIGTLNVKTATFNSTVNNNISDMIDGNVDNNNNVVATVENMIVNSSSNLTLDKKVQAKALVNNSGNITVNTLLSSDLVDLKSGNLILNDRALISSYEQIERLSNNNNILVNDCSNCISAYYRDVKGDLNSKIIFNSGNAVIYANLDTKGSLEFRDDAYLSKIIRGSINVNSLNITTGNTLHFNRTTSVSVKDINVASGSALELDLNGGTAKVNGTVKFADETSKLVLKNYEVLEANTIYANNAKLDIFIDAERDKNFVDGGEKQIFSGDIIGNFNIVNTHTGNYIVQTTSDKHKIKILVAGSQNAQNNNVVVNANPVLGAIINKQTNNSVLNSIAERLEQDYSNGNIAEVIDALVDNDDSTTVSVATETLKQLNSVVSSRLNNVSSIGRSASDNEITYGDLAVWIKGVYSKAELKDSGNSYGFKSNTTGVVIGFEDQMSDYLKLGVGYMYSNGDIKRTTRRTLDVKSHTGFMYGELTLNNFFATGIVSYTKSTYDQNKTIYDATLSSSYDSKTMSAQAMFGYGFNINSFVLTPQAGVRFINVSQGAYNDGLVDIEKSTVNSVALIAGVKLSTIIDTYSSIKIRPIVYVNATDELNDDGEKNGSSYKSRKTRVAKLANGATFNIVDRRINPFGIEAGLGLNLEFGRSFELSLNYDGNFRKDYSEHTGTFGLKYKF